MRRIFFLVFILAPVLCLPVIFYAQMSTADKFQMQDQFDKFKNRIRNNAQQTMTGAQEIVEDKKVEAVQYQEKQEVASDVFDKLAKRSQQSGISSTLHIYAFPLLIIAIVGVIILVLWHQNL